MHADLKWQDFFIFKGEWVGQRGALHFLFSISGSLADSTAHHLDSKIQD